jgi:putative hydrolase
MSMLKVDMHIHSIASGHSISTIDEIIRQAKSKKMTHIAITEHGPSMEGAPHQDYFWISDKLPRHFGKLKVFFGCEANIIDTKGNLDLKEEHLRNQHIIIAGLHEKTPYPSNLSMQQNTMAIINAMEKKCVSIISHPIRPEFPTNVDDLVSAAVENNVILELNTHIMKNVSHTNYMDEYKHLVKQAKNQEAQLIVNSDAHAHYFIGDDFILKKLGRVLGLSCSDLLNFDYKHLEKILEAHRYG